ncbi:OLC1v1036540C1 [Oldenlandia corymbosa var. corymbosa]|uniref:OLC1v1036540C1 n=1 Tax=Oldenlandia corymbosa var. corymbosa TaxID=529605 RepID=A0AAV1CWS0_OLDCO|nr:OLC1v1036540C1 [Oldenlandia corymbosa var. corymbosa]
MARIYQGRKKIEIKKIENESRLSVTFAKRRSGLMKKASELCILCDAKIALILFSPKNKVYSFAHPNLEAVIGDYLQGNTLRFDRVLETHQAAENQKLNEEFKRIDELLKAEQEQREVLDEAIKKRKDQNNWWEGPIEDLNLQQLEHLMKEMEGLKMNVDREIDRQKRVEETRANHAFIKFAPTRVAGTSSSGASGYGSPAAFLPPGGGGNIGVPARWPSN